MLPESKKDLFKEILKVHRWDLVTDDYILSKVPWPIYVQDVFEPWLKKNIDWLKYFLSFDEKGNFFYFTIDGILDMNITSDFNFGSVHKYLICHAHFNYKKVSND